MKNRFLILTVFTAVLLLVACGNGNENTAAVDTSEMNREELLAHYGVTQLNIGLVLMDDHHIDYFLSVHGNANTRFIETDPANFDHLRGLMQRLEIGIDNE
ncbi:MAG: hypothetical protein FWG67_08710 [Defluviitaleaceae bacterium]|nr:hypothetical protein [Defluviitaleaceae bacterium]